jgi:hypothetical protein
MISEIPKEVWAKHPYSGNFGVFNAQNGHFPEPNAHRSGNVLGSIRNARAKLMMLLHLIRGFWPILVSVCFFAVIFLLGDGALLSC